MYCIRPYDSDSEPEFETVTALSTPPRPPLNPAVEALVALEPGHAAGIVAAHSSPKLRLTFDEHDTLMTDEEVERIGGGHDDVESVRSAVKSSAGLGERDELRQLSPLLPATPSPHAHGSSRGNAGDCHPHQHENGHYNASAPVIHNNGSSSDSGPSKLDVPVELQHQLSRLGLQQPDHTRQVSNSAIKVYNCDLGVNTATAIPTPAADMSKMKKIREKTRPRPLSIVPRLGTLTALPGSRMVTDTSIASRDDVENIDSETDQPTSRESPIPQIPARTSSLYAPSPVPWTPVSTSTPTPTSTTSGRVSFPLQTYTNPQPHQSVAPSALKSNLRFRPDTGQSNSSHKRKLSLSAPFTNNIKRILARTGSRERKKQCITHLTHEATAGNRFVGCHVDGAVKSGGDSRVGHGLMESPVSTGSGSSTATTAATEATVMGPATATAVHMIPRRDLVTPVFAGPSDTIASSTPPPPTTPSPGTTTGHHFHAATSLFRPRTSHHHSSSTSATHNSATALDPTSKSALHKLIVQLRSQISDLTLENQVLKDQIAIVRKDWIDTSGELEVERHRVWEGEMERFRLGVRVEELRGEVRKLRRGSVDVDE